MPATIRARRLRPGVPISEPADATESAPRERSPEADHALDAFADLRRYFRRDVQLAVALGWNEATAVQWRDRLVVRPQRAKATQVMLLDELAREARAYLESDTDVGEWLN